MNRAYRAAVAVFLLALVVALPAAALPARERTALPEGRLATLWTRLATVLGLFDASRAGADPDGGAAPPPQASTPQDTGDSRSSGDPNG
jgi:hypothetical protein